MKVWKFISCVPLEPVDGLTLHKGQSFRNKNSKHVVLLTICSFSIIIAVCVCAYVQWEVHSCPLITYDGHSYFYSTVVACWRWLCRFQCLHFILMVFMLCRLEQEAES